jgi:hypothetical protein
MFVRVFEDELWDPPLAQGTRETCSLGVMRGLWLVGANDVDDLGVGG